MLTRKLEFDITYTWHHLYSTSLILDITYTWHHLYLTSLILDITYTRHHLYLTSLILDITYTWHHLYLTSLIQVGRSMVAVDSLKNWCNDTSQSFLPHQTTLRLQQTAEWFYTWQDVSNKWQQIMQMPVRKKMQMPVRKKSIKESK